jgi:hypothetical protein
VSTRPRNRGGFLNDSKKPRRLRVNAVVPRAVDLLERTRGAVVHTRYEEGVRCSLIAVHAHKKVEVPECLDYCRSIHAPSRRFGQPDGTLLSSERPMRFRPEFRESCRDHDMLGGTGLELPNFGFGRPPGCVCDELAQLTKVREVPPPVRASISSIYCLDPCAVPYPTVFPSVWIAMVNARHEAVRACCPRACMCGRDGAW